MLRVQSAVHALARATLSVFILLAACSDPSGPPRVASVSVEPATPSVTAGGTVQLIATPLSSSAAPIPQKTIAWTSLNTEVATVNASGLVTARSAGSARINATVDGVVGFATITVTPPPVATVTIVPLAPSTTVGGTVQLSAVLQDATGATLTGRLVTWTTSNAGIAEVDANGPVVQVRGIAAGSAMITATSEGKSASVTVTVAGALTITSISPATLVPGGTATIGGEGFGANGGTTVTIGGVTVPVTAATGTSLTVSLPSGICLPTGLVVVRVAVTSSGTSVQQNHAFQTSAPPLALAVGRQTVITDPAAFCLQFAASATSESYLVGVQSISEVPTLLTSAVVRGAIPATTTGSVSLSSLQGAVAPVATAGSDQLVSGRARRWQRHRQAEAALRARELAQIPFRSRVPTTGLAVNQLSVPSVPATAQVGDSLDITVPDRNADLCQNSIPIRAIVRHVGLRSYWLEDVGNPAGGLTAADYQNLSNVLDNSIWVTNTNYFGMPTDNDANSRIVIVITKEVNRPGGILGFASTTDLGNCPSSNEGEYFYGFAPDSAGLFALGAITAEDARTEIPPLIAHEFTHIIQLGRRIMNGATLFPTIWELEGQATFAEEVNGHAALGKSIGQNYGFNVAFNTTGVQGAAPPDGPIFWYISPFIDLAFYYGVSFPVPGQPAVKIENAPEQCGWLAVPTSANGNLGPCGGGRSHYGVSWSLLRWLSDQFGPTFPGGEPAMHRAMIDNNRRGFDNISNLVGQPIDQLLAQWAAALYVDDRNIANLDPKLTFTSWAMGGDGSGPQATDVFDRLIPEARLITRGRSFSAFTDQVSVRAGSSAYFTISGLSRPNTAISVNAGSGPLPSNMRLWVVRMQ